MTGTQQYLNRFRPGYDMGQSCSGSRSSYSSETKGAGKPSKGVVGSEGVGIVVTEEHRSMSEYYVMLTVDVTNLQSTGKFPSREDFLDAIEDGDFSRRNGILELMVVSSNKELWATFMEYLKSNKDVNLRVNWPGLAHLAIFVRERTHFEIIHNACKYWDPNTVHELFESCMHSGGLGALEIGKFILSKYSSKKDEKAKISSEDKSVEVDLNRRNSKGQTYLHIVSMYSMDLNFVKFLVEHGADPRVKDNNGKTAIDVAKAIFEVRKIFSSDNAKYKEILQCQKNYKLNGCGYNGYEEAADQVELSAKIVDVLEKQSEKLEAQNNTGSEPTTKDENN